MCAGLWLLGLLTLVGGCATDHLVVLSTTRVEAPSAASGGITGTNAVQIFDDIAGRLGFDIVCPAPLPQGNGPVMQYTAFSRPENPRGYGRLNIFVTADGVCFYCAARDLAHAQSMASLFEEKLKGGGIRYEESTRSESGFY